MTVGAIGVSLAWNNLYQGLIKIPVEVIVLFRKSDKITSMF